MEANLRAFKAGFHFGETAELFESSYQVQPAVLAPGEYVNITGNTAIAWGLIAAATRSRAPPVPRHLPDHAGIGHPPRAVQAQAVRGEDVPGRGRDLRDRRRPGRRLRRCARRHHHLRARASTSSRRPWAWPSAWSSRCWSSTSSGEGRRPACPTKTEQADLLHAMYGRHGEAPAPHRGGQDPVPLLRGHRSRRCAWPSSTARR